MITTTQLNEKNIQPSTFAFKKHILKEGKKSQ